MSAPRPVDTLRRIETPENVRLVFRLAGPGTRMFAYLVDLALRVAVGGLVVYFLMVVAGLFAAVDFSGGLILLLLFFFEWGYFWFFEAFWNGKSPGKHVFGLRVVKAGGYPISFFDAMLRNLLRGVDALPSLYALGLVSMTLTPRLQRLGDLVADTMVVRDEHERAGVNLEILENVEPLPRAQLNAGYRPSERTLVLLDRYARESKKLSAARADEIADILAGPLRNRLGYEDAPDVPAERSRDFLLRVLRTFSATEGEVNR